MVRPPCCDKLKVKKGLWSEEEDAKILYVSKHGLVVIIAQQLPGRTDNDVKNYWNTKLKKKLSEMGIDPVTHKPFSQILADYGNIGGLPKSRTEIGSLNRDMKNTFMIKPEPYQPQPPTSATHGFTSINNNQLTHMAAAPGIEPIFTNNNLQAIKIVTEASNYAGYQLVSPMFPNYYSLSSSPSSSSTTSSSTCSTAAQEKTGLAFSWRDFILNEAFLPPQVPESDDTALQNHRSNNTSVQHMDTNNNDNDDNGIVPGTGSDR
ncbi:Dynein light chain type 1 family protein, putative isoform 1 [Hibiscus syriacus]|uniref:Dynein light chain type 1 family protein, putative isoform 1 n=1 Tax=Hibiscus syriacus TaxID=106335 RepID=A0A6A2Y3R4_HIBSY|nr:Dynein light chain type 1 family protein, putative isoform 1 [Hibiscus syriacus]